MSGKNIGDMTPHELKDCTNAAINAVYSTLDATTARFEAKYEGSLSCWLDALWMEYEDRGDRPNAVRCEAAYNELREGL